MPRKRQRVTVERGAISFFYRGERVFFSLTPDDGTRPRLIAIGRKRIPPSRRRDRFLAFVGDIGDVAPDQPAGDGKYEIVTHDGHTHLEYTLDDRPDPRIERTASWIVMVANPDPRAWGIDPLDAVQLELFPLHEDDEPPLVTPFPDELQARFGEKRFIDAGREFLDYAGAELVLMGAKG
jgi:hypothetical protein